MDLKLQKNFHHVSSKLYWTLWDQHKKFGTPSLMVKLYEVTTGLGIKLRLIEALTEHDTKLKFPKNEMLIGQV